MNPRQYDGHEGLRRRWAREAEEAAAANLRNEALVACTRTRYKVGDVVLLEGRTRVRIVEVQPPGFISVPRKYSILGRWMEPVTCDVALYRYRPESKPDGASGQTTEDRLSPLPA